MPYGIDIGSTAVKVAALRRTVRGYKVVAAARRRAPRPEDGAAEAKAALPRLLYEALGPRNGSRRPGVLGLSGRDLNLQLVLQPAMKPLNYRVMMGYELEQRRGEGGDLYVDYCTLREPDAYFPQYLALVGLAKRAYVDERIELARRAGVDVRDAVPNAFALYAAYRNACEPEAGTVLLLDVGSDAMDLAFVRGGRLLFARNVSTGARAFDQQIAASLGVSLEEAERLKVAHANLGPPGPGADEEREEQLRAPVRAAAGQLAGVVSSSIQHARLQLNDRDFAVDRVLLSGGGARLRGLAGYLSGALKVPVEFLDPFAKLDLSGLSGPDVEEFRRLPTDMAVALGLGQIGSPPPALAASTLSILPDALQRRRNFFRTTLWLLVGGAALAASLGVATVLAAVRKGAEESALAAFQSRTADVRRRMEEMEALRRDQRELAARLDALGGPVAGGRAVLDVVARLRRALPPGIAVQEIRLGDPPARRDDRFTMPPERFRVAFVSRQRGLVVGDLEGDPGGREIRVKGHPEPFGEEDVADGLERGVLRWPAPPRAIVVAGEVDENIRGGAREALRALRDQLSDPPRGVKASIQSQRAGEKPGWRAFEILVQFE